MSTNEETALILAARGIAVFPCRGKDTKPPLKPKEPLDTVHGFYDATTDQAQIKRWWKSYPEALIGVPIEQLGAVGVDIDCHPGKPDGRPVWKAFVKEHSGGIEPNYGFGQDTLSGGTLRLFKRPEGLRIPGSLAPGIDLKVSGYFCTGEGYRPHKSHGFDRPLPQLPAWIIDRITPKEAPQEERAQLPPGDTDTTARNMVKTALAKWIVEEGGRNNAGIKLACILRDIPLSKGEAERYMIQYRAGCPVGGDPYTEKEMFDSLDSAYSRPPRQPPQGKNPPKQPARARDKAPTPQAAQTPDILPQAGDFTPAADPPEPEFDQAPGTTEAPQEEHKSTGPQFKTGLEILLTKYEPVPQIIPDIIPAGLSIIAGRAKRGKTTLVYQAAQSICTPGGGMFLGRKVDPGKVLYLSLEELHEAIQERMQDQGWTQGQAKNITIVTLEEFRKTFGFLHTKGAAGRLCDYVAANQFRLVVIDTFARAFLGLRDQDKNEVITQALTPLHQLSNTLNFASLFIDHHGHQRGPGFNPDPVNDVMSSSAKAQVADTIIGFYDDGPNKRKLKITGRRVPEQDISLAWDGLTRCYQSVEVDQDEAELSGNPLKIRRWLRKNEPANLTQISEGTGIKKPNLSPVLKTLTRDGYLVFDENTRLFNVYST